MRSLVIIGANGSGKSRMGIWLEEHSGAIVHRIAAQRALQIPALIQPRPYQQVESELRYGHYNSKQPLDFHIRSKRGHRWGNNPESHLLNDYELLLALLFAQAAKRDRDYTKSAREVMPNNLAPPANLDVLCQIWSSVLPHRKLIVGDDKLEAQTPAGTSYHAGSMSDGERVTIYLIGQSLCAPRNAVIVVDEPEIHLHRAIQGRLWDQIELARPDCAFVYITHDLDFAATRTAARKVWLKTFHGDDKWEWEEITRTSTLPDALLFQVLGSRQPLLFVEGDESSDDTAIYTALFPDELVIPRQSCDKVIEATKAMRELSNLHRLAVRGIVDRDRRSEEHIAALRQSDVLVAEVAEVENLFCLPEVVQDVAIRLSHPDVAVARAAVEASVLTEFAKDIERQSLAHALAVIQFRLNGFGPKIAKLTATQLEAELQNYLKGIDFAATVAERRALFNGIVDRKDFRAALRVFNSKGIPSFISRELGVDRDVYCQMVLSVIKSEPAGPVAVAMRKAIEG